MASEPQPSPRELRRIFDEYDADSNGLIDHTEMVRRLLFVTTRLLWPRRCRCVCLLPRLPMWMVYGTSTDAWFAPSPNPHACTHPPIVSFPSPYICLLPPHCVPSQLRNQGALLVALGAKVSQSQEELEAAFAKIDADRDGGISADEFVVRLLLPVPRLGCLCVPSRM